jgi:hypothetical protein
VIFKRNNRGVNIAILGLKILALMKSKIQVPTELKSVPETSQAKFL